MLALALAVRCGEDAPALRNLDATGRCVVILGDSLTEGYGIDAAHAYPALLAERLGVPVVPAGRSGDETRDGLRRFDAVVPKHDPFLVVVQLCGNDFMHRVPQDETFRNIEQLVLKVQRLGAAAVIVSVDVDAIGDSYGQGYRSIGEQYGAGVVTGLLNDVMLKPKYLLDPIHPNERGHELLAERMAEVLRPILARMPAAQAGSRP